MPRKIRELKADLRRAGCTMQPGKGSHTGWRHPLVRGKVTLSGNDGDDAKAYREEYVRVFHYSMVIEWDPRDQIYVVRVPELDGCITHGVTYEEAVQQGQSAIATWISAARAWNDPIPEPHLYGRAA